MMPCIFSGSRTSAAISGSSCMSIPMRLAVLRTSSISVPGSSRRLNFDRREVAALIGHGAELAVGNRVQRPVVMPQLDGTDAERLDGALQPPGVDVFADPERVVPDIKQPGNDVANQRLRAERDRQPEHAGSGDQRRGVDAEMRQHDQRRDHRDDPPNAARSIGSIGLQARAGRRPRRRRRAGGDRDRHPADGGRSPARRFPGDGGNEQLPTAMPIECIARAALLRRQSRGLRPRSRRARTLRRARPGAQEAVRRARRQPVRAGKRRAGRGRVVPAASASAACRRRAAPEPPPGSIPGRVSTTTGRATGQT